MGAYWSKMIKLAGLLLSFANGEQPTLNMGQIQEARGVAGAALVWCPGMADCLLPIFDAMLSHAAKHFGEKPIDKQFVPDPRVKGSVGSQADAWESVRSSINIVLRLAGIERAGLFKVSFEAALPMPLRLAFPG